MTNLSGLRTKKRRSLSCAFPAIPSKFHTSVNETPGSTSTTTGAFTPRYEAEGAEDVGCRRVANRFGIYPIGDSVGSLLHSHDPRRRIQAHVLTPARMQRAGEWRY